LNIDDWVVFLALFTPTVMFVRSLGSGGVWPTISQCHAHSGPGPAEGPKIWKVQNFGRSKNIFSEGEVVVGHLRKKFLLRSGPKIEGANMPPLPPGSVGPARDSICTMGAVE